ncbi:MAG: hypothetical protein RR931_03465, partial [Mucinivorans sp.]
VPRAMSKKRQSQPKSKKAKPRQKNRLIFVSKGSIEVRKKSFYRTCFLPALGRGRLLNILYSGFIAF